jgi:endoglucanase
MFPTALATASPSKPRSLRTSASLFLLAALQCAALSSAWADDQWKHTAKDPALDATFPMMPPGNAPGQSLNAKKTAKALGSGINLGNMFETPKGNGDWGVPPDSKLDYVPYVDLAVEAGFNHIRLPVRWSSHASADAEGKLDEAFATRVDKVVDRALERGLYVVLNMHHYSQLDGEKPAEGEPRVDSEVVVVRFLNMWRQIAKRYAGRSDKLLFEIYNEPHKALDPSWNALASRALREIRSTNPERVVVIGPERWNAANALALLELPNDGDLIITFHSYEPFTFTHQGASWVNPSPPVGQTCCDDTQKAAIKHSLDTANEWSQDNKYSVYMGEFGAFSSGPMDSRVAYTKLVRETGEAYGMPTAYWELASGFGVYDPETKTWRKPLLEALKPSKPAQ